MPPVRRLRRRASRSSGTLLRRKKPLSNAQVQAAEPPQNEVLALQRTFGNRAVQRFAADGALDALQRQPWMGNHQAQSTLLHRSAAFIQRAETGIRGSTSTNKYAKAVFDFAQAPGNQDKPVAALKQVLADSVNAELKAADVYAITIANGAPGASGEFDFGTWAIELNEATAFPGATKISDLTDAQISDVADTIYHESRHAEQWYRIARSRAGKALAQTATNQERDRAAAQIATDMDIPARVAQAACARPLYASWASKHGGAPDKKVQEAEAWDKSVYGADATYRNEIVLGDVNDDAEKLAKILAKVDGLLTDSYSKLPSATRKKIRTQLKAAQTHFDDLVAAKAGVIQDEIDRLNGIRTPTANDTLMLNHLTVVRNSITTLEAKFPSKTRAKVSAASAAATTMKDELYQAYLDLPEEADAWPTGQAAGAEYDRLLSAPTGG